MAFIILCEHHGAHVAWFAARVAEDDLRSCTGPLTRAKHDPPVIHRILLQQQHFKLPAGVSIDSPEAGGDHAGVVEHQHIVRTQIVEEVAELPVFNQASFPMQDQQTRPITSDRGSLRNQRRRQLEIEISGLHGRPSIVTPARGFKYAEGKISLEVSSRRRMGLSEILLGSPLGFWLPHLAE